MYNYRTEQYDELTSEQARKLTVDAGRDYVPRINLGPEMTGDGPAVGLYNCLIALKFTPIKAIEEVHRTIVGASTRGQDR